MNTQTTKQDAEDEALAEKVRVRFLADHITRTVVNTCTLCKDIPTGQLQAEILTIVSEWKDAQISRLDGILATL